MDKAWSGSNHKEGVWDVGGYMVLHAVCFWPVRMTESYRLGYSVDFAGLNCIIQRVCIVVSSDKKSVFWTNIVIIQNESFADIYHCWSGENYTLSFPD